MHRTAQLTAMVNNLGDRELFQQRTALVGRLLA